MSKYARTYHLPWSLGATNDDRIARSVESLLGIDIVITEKLDGENCGMTRGGVYARSHAAYTTSPWSREVRQIHQRIRYDLSDGVYLFGENMEGIHSIEYKQMTSYFYLFGVRDNSIWIPWQDVEEYSYLLDLPTVPVLFKGQCKTETQLRKLTEKLAIEPSELGGLREGIVVRNAGLFHDSDFSQNVMKWVRAEHVDSDQHWTRNWKKASLNIR